MHITFRFILSRSCVTFLLLFTIATSFSQQPYKLWYDKPASNSWTSALPIGNGRLAGMVYGNPAMENIQLNESSVWSGSPNRNDNPDALASLPEIRKLIFGGKQKEAQEIAAKTMQSKKSSGQMFLPVGNLCLKFTGHENYSDYYRELDIEKAVTTSSYTVDGVKYTREIFASLPAQAIIIRLTADKPSKLHFTAFVQTQQHGLVKAKKNEIILSGTTPDHEGVKGMVTFQSTVYITPTGGTLSTSDTSVTITNATAATIFISIASNFINYHDISGDAKKRCESYLTGAIKKSYAELKAAHVASYQKYFNRVKLDLGSSEAVNKPTDVRLKEFASTFDPQFVSLYFQFGRYLLISASQPGGQPANLQGIWNDQMKPSWDSKYTININSQMNYWPAEKTNLAELHEPFLQMVKDMSETGKETAKVMYGARGWMAHHNTDIWRITGPVDAIFWGVWSMGGAWCSQHLWEHYLYNGDQKYLQSIYPILKGAATFFVDDLVEEPSHKWLVINPGTSPENEPKNIPSRKGVSFDAGTTMDNQIVFDMLSTTISAAEILKTDMAFVDTLKMVRKRLPPMHIGQYGQLQEWIEDLDDPKDNHRHISHLYGLFPSQQISSSRTPELFSAANTTLLQRGDISTGWSMGWKVNWWARMLDGNHAYKLIQNQLSPLGVNAGGGTYTNLFDAHPPFQIDGNFGCTSGIAEMLMQSQDGAIYLLPALPDVWKNGSISGLRTRGGFTISDLQWKDRGVVAVTIVSALGGNCRIRSKTPLRSSGDFKITDAKNTNPNPLFQTVETPQPIISPKATIKELPIPSAFEYDIKTEPGKHYTLVIDLAKMLENKVP